MSVKLFLFHVSLVPPRDGRRCAKKESRFPIPYVGETSVTLAGQAFGVVQDGVHVTGCFSAVVPGDWDQPMGHTESSV